MSHPCALNAAIMPFMTVIVFTQEWIQPIKQMYTRCKRLGNQYEQGHNIIIITNIFLICMCLQSLERGNKELMNE